MDRHDGDGIKVGRRFALVVLVGGECVMDQIIGKPLEIELAAILARTKYAPAVFLVVPAAAGDVLEIGEELGKPRERAESRSALLRPEVYGLRAEFIEELVKIPDETDRLSGAEHEGLPVFHIFFESRDGF